MTLSDALSTLGVSSTIASTWELLYGHGVPLVDALRTRGLVKSTLVNHIAAGIDKGLLVAFYAFGRKDGPCSQHCAFACFDDVATDVIRRLGIPTEVVVAIAVALQNCVKGLRRKILPWVPFGFSADIPVAQDSVQNAVAAPALVHDADVSDLLCENEPRSRISSKAVVTSAIGLRSVTQAELSDYYGALTLVRSLAATRELVMTICFPRIVGAAYTPASPTPASGAVHHEAAAAVTHQSLDFVAAPGLSDVSATAGATNVTNVIQVDLAIECEDGPDDAALVAAVAAFEANGNHVTAT